MDIPVASNFSLFTSLQESPYIWLLGPSQKFFGFLFFFSKPTAHFSCCLCSKWFHFIGHLEMIFCEGPVFPLGFLPFSCWFVGTLYICWMQVYKSLARYFYRKYFERRFGRHSGGKVNRSRWLRGGEEGAGVENHAPILGTKWQGRLMGPLVRWDPRRSHRWGRCWWIRRVTRLCPAALRTTWGSTGKGPWVSCRPWKSWARQAVLCLFLFFF